MSQPDCPLDILRLLIDADFTIRPDTGTWSHRDGRPFTETEQNLAHQATDLELETLIFAYRLGLAQGLCDDPARVARVLLHRYARNLPDGTAREDIVAAMTGEDRTEYERLSYWARTGIRPEVVALLLDADLPALIATKTLTHRDGRPFTQAEQALAATCTDRETEAVLAQIKLELDFDTEQEADAPRAMEALLAKYYGHVPAGTLIGDPGAAMTDEDRAEYESLLYVLAPEPGDLLAHGED
ncbi:MULTISPECIES: hypothetical protein [Kitasatospora]|uniref:Uncharacterized protein n=1 Tax=Kitasatospora setae (strain ATCC 33774 / DSM 43861 / JCM 3304 / KCC A-0304 / NBRC 14216 / KM-6054) TaxID=452652 RepID=E4NEQ9_KITSK|nr:MULTISPECIES: hypothetical protein [Kitasatospora]BAJ29845.1 hypothetical protein KSE_40540 [Kitasatospora setae KM-6054]